VNWAAFLNEFCKVQSVCYEGNPNWLGWILIGFFLLIVYSISAVLFGYVSDKFERFDDGVTSKFINNRRGAVIYYFWLALKLCVAFVVTMFFFGWLLRDFVGT
jgi:MFS family permease